MVFWEIVFVFKDDFLSIWCDSIIICDCGGNIFFWNFIRVCVIYEEGNKVWVLILILIFFFWLNIIILVGDYIFRDIYYFKY